MRIFYPHTNAEVAEVLFKTKADYGFALIICALFFAMIVLGICGLIEGDGSAMRMDESCNEIVGLDWTVQGTIEAYAKICGATQAVAKLEKAK